MRWMLPLMLATGCTACGAIPADVGGSVERIERDRRFRVGLIEPQSDPANTRRYLADVARSVGAAPRIETGATEPLLLRLEQGELDLVIGEFDRKTPWSKRVFALPPLASRRIGASDVDLTPVARNGENRWIALLDAQAKANGQ